MISQLSAEARNLNWLVSNFVERVPGVSEATVVSSDGLLIALSDGLDRSSGDRLAAVAAGLLSIAKGGSTPIGGGRVHEVIVEMDQAMSRGWAVLEGDGLHGMIFLHPGDESEFVAWRVEGAKRTKRN